MVTNGKWQPVYSLYEEKSSQQLSKKMNHFQESDISRFLKMSNSPVHRIVKKQMKAEKGLDRLREKGPMSKRKFVRNSNYDSTNTTLKMTRGRLLDAFDSSKFRNSARPPCPRNCTKIRNKREIQNDDIVGAKDNFEPICPMKCKNEPPGTNYMVKVLPMVKEGDNTDDDDDEDENDSSTTINDNPCGKCKKVKSKTRPYPVCSKCYYCFEGKPMKIKFLYSIACPGGKGLEPLPPPPTPPTNPPCQQQPPVKLPPFVCKPPQCRQVLYCKYFQCTSLGFFPDERDCTKYFFCDLNNNGFQLYHMTCPNGRIFDPKLRECRLKDVMKKRDVERCWIEKDVEKLSDIIKNKRNKDHVMKVTADKLKFDIILNKKKRGVYNPPVETSIEKPTIKIDHPNPEKLIFDVHHPIPENVFTNPNYGSGSTYRLPVVVSADQSTVPCCPSICKPKTTKKCKKPKKPTPCTPCPKPKPCPTPPSCPVKICCPPPPDPPKPCPPPPPPCPLPPPPCPPPPKPKCDPCPPKPKCDPCPPKPKCDPCPPKPKCDPCPPKPCPSKRKTDFLPEGDGLVASLRNSAGEPAKINWLPRDDVYVSRGRKERTCKSVGTFPDPFDCDKYIKCESTELNGSLRGRPLKLIRRVCPPGLFFHRKDLKCRSKKNYSNKYLVRHCFRDLKMSNRRLKDKLGHLTQILTSNAQPEKK